MGKQVVKTKFAGYIALGKIFATVLNFAIPLFLTRFLSKNDYGLYSQYYTVTLFIGQIFSMGIYSSLFYFYPNAGDGERKSYVGNVFVMLLILGLLGCIFTILPISKDILFGEGELLKYSLIISISVLLIIPSTMLSPMYVVRLDKTNTVLYPPVEIIAKVSVIFLCSILFGTLRSILVGVVFFHLAVFLYTVLNVFFDRKFKFIFSVDKVLFKKQLTYAIPFGLTIILSTFSQRFDKIISITYLSTNEFAIYSIAFFGIPGVQQIYDSLSQVNVMQMAVEHKKGNREGVIRNYRNFVVKTLSFSVPIIFIVFLYSREIIIFLFTKTYEQSTFFFRIYILSFIVGMFGAGTILRAIGKTNLSFRAFLMSVVFSIPTTYFLIRSYGANGAIISAMVGILLPKIIQMFFEMRTLNISFKEYFPWTQIFKITMISCGLLVPFILIHETINLNTYLCFMLSIVYLSGTYLLMIRQNVFLINGSQINLIINKYIKKR
ncbi:MAG: oligosaccharide flippase family protein [Chitinophagaceae bacterium]|nr:oligosaccharide flippase family protein [Chitinophagaceae bacterium]